jgi:hypothetical protein
MPKHSVVRPAQYVTSVEDPFAFGNLVWAQDDTVLKYAAEEDIGSLSVKRPHTDGFHRGIVGG